MKWIRNTGYPSLPLPLFLWQDTRSKWKFIHLDYFIWLLSKQFVLYDLVWSWTSETSRDQIRKILHANCDHKNQFVQTVDSGKPEAFRICNRLVEEIKKLKVFGGHLLSEDDHSHWAPPYWNIMKETFSLGRTELLKLSNKSFGDVYKEYIVPNNSSFFTIYAPS